MAHTAFADAAKLIDRLEKQLNLSVVMKDRTRILKQELRFLSTFLTYTANRCTDYENLPDLFTSVKDLELIVENLLLVLPPSRREELPSILSDAAADVLYKIQLVKPEIRQVQFKVLTLSGSGCRMSDEFVLEFFDTLLEDLRELLGCEADLIQSSLRERIEVLERKLTSLKGLLSFTAKRSEEHDKLDQLFAHVQAVADNAAYIAYSCLTKKMDEDTAPRLAVQISDVQKIDPVKLEVREIYIGVLEASRSSESKSDTYEMDKTLVDFVDSLLECTLELVYREITPVKDHIEILQVELIRLKYFLKDAERFTKPRKSDDLVAQMEVMVIDAGSVIYSLFEDEVNQEIGKQMRLALAKLVNKFKIVREIYASIVKARISNLPRSDVLETLDLLLRDSKELLGEPATSITLLKDHIQMVQRDLGSLRSFLTMIIEQHLKHDKVEDIWRRIIYVMYELEYIIGLVTTKDGPVLHHMSWIFYLTEEIKLIKKEISEIQNTDKNIRGLQEHDITKICSGPALSPKSASKINEEMVGFKDEEKRLVEQLVRGSMLVQIVSIVGMP